MAVADHVSRLRKLGIAGFNLSLDSLDSARFSHITRRDALAPVKDTLDRLVKAGIPLKINVVVQQGVNTDEIASLAHLAKSRLLTVSFIELMPKEGLFARVVRGGVLAKGDTIQKHVQTTTS